MKICICAFLAAVQLTLPTSLLAHSTSETESQALWPPEILDDHQKLIDNELDTERSVVDQFKIWEAGQTLKACFFSGEKAAKDFFVEMAGDWQSVTSISFDFGPLPDYYSCSNAGDYHLRISFSKGGGNWSYIGTDSTRIAQSKPSLNIDAAEPFSLNDRRALGGTILHELGHALAMKHEHQSPAARCEEEMNWPLIYQELAGSPNKMKPDEVDRNFRRLVASPRLRAGEYDPKSIMHYALPSRWFTNGSSAKCYIKKNTSLSNLDKAAAKETYPASPQKQDNYLNQLHSALAVRLNQEKISDDKVEVLNSVINSLASSLPGREIDADLKGKINLIDANTSGNCSPIITDAGDISIVCN